MSDRAAFLEAIIRDRDDDTARLAFADWLTEQGEEERGEFIRVQVELANWEPPYSPWCKGCGWVYEQCSCKNPPRRPPQIIRRDELRRRERELLDQPRCVAWMGEAVRLTPTGANYFDHLAFSRGFIASVTCTAADWIKHESKLFWHPTQDRPCPETAHPLEHVILTTYPAFGSIPLYATRERTLEVYAEQFRGVTFDIPEPPNVGRYQVVPQHSDLSGEPGDLIFWDGRFAGVLHSPGLLMTTGEFQYPCRPLPERASVGAWVAGELGERQIVRITRTESEVIGLLTRAADAGDTTLFFMLYADRLAEPAPA